MWLRSLPVWQQGLDPLFFVTENTVGKGFRKTRPVPLRPGPLRPAPVRRRGLRRRKVASGKVGTFAKGPRSLLAYFVSDSCSRKLDRFVDNDDALWIHEGNARAADGPKMAYKLLLCENCQPSDFG